MFRLLDEPLAAPRRNPEDVDEDLLEGLGADSVLQPKPTLPPPVLRWRVQGKPGPRPCRALLLTTPGTRALLPLLLPSQPQPQQSNTTTTNDDFYDTQLLLGSVLLPGVSLSGNRATSVSHPTNLGCFLYRASAAAADAEGEWDPDAVVVCACNAEVPVESQHALARLLLSHLAPREHTLILDLLKDGGAAPGDELAPHALHGMFEEDEMDAPFLLRTLQTTSSSNAAPARSGLTLVEAKPLEEGVPVTGVGAAVLARCQLLSLPATALIVAVPPMVTAPVSVLEKGVSGVVAAARGAVGLAGGKGEDGSDGGALRVAAKSLMREGQGRLAGGNGGMLYM